MSLFSQCNNTNKKGTLGLGRCISYFTDIGFIVSLPLNDSQKYDLIVDDGNKLHRVQVKTTSRKNKLKTYFAVKLEVCSHNFNEPFDKNAVDILFVLCEDETRYCIPSQIINSKTSLTLTEEYNQYMILK